MRKGKLLQIGSSCAVVIPTSHLRQLGWWRGDTITQEIVDGKVVLTNLNPHTIRRVHTTEEYGDSITRSTQRPV